MYSPLRGITAYLVKGMKTNMKVTYNSPEVKTIDIEIVDYVLADSGVGGEGQVEPGEGFGEE